MANKKITDVHIQDVYNKFRDYIKANGLKVLEDKKQAHIIEEIKRSIKNEAQLDWNDASLSDYINNLIYMFKGEQFARTINKYAEEYLIDQICKDFAPVICKNAKEALEKHKSYYRSITSNKNIRTDNISREKAFKKWLSETPNQQGNIFPEERIKGIIKRLKEDIPEKLNKVDGVAIYQNLFLLDDIEKLQQIKNRFSSNGDLYEWDYNDHGHGGCSAALYQYIKYLKQNRGEESLIDKGKIKNIILYGVPGVGKTHNTKKFISLVESGKGEKEIFDIIKRNDFAQTDISELKSRVSFITFHQSFGYEDFIEGFRPNENGQIKLVDGVFKRLCAEARENKEQNYYLIIDEINRGNISKIFGELITLIEEDKRDTYEVTLPYSKEKFSVPSNLYIIGTMNSTDKSIALIDVALRRRFTFLKMELNSKLIKYGKAKEIFEALNVNLEEKLGREHLIGHSYFMNIQNDEELDFVLEYKINPLLEEYFYGDEGSLNEILESIGLK